MTHDRLYLYLMLTGILLKAMLLAYLLGFHIMSGPLVAFALLQVKSSPAPDDPHWAIITSNQGIIRGVSMFARMGLVLFLVWWATR